MATTSLAALANAAEIRPQDRADAKFHANVKYTLHNGVKFNSGSVSVTMSCNGSQLGQLSLDSSTKDDTDGDTSVEQRYYLNPNMRTGENTFNVKGVVGGIIEHPWVSVTVEITADGERVSLNFWTNPDTPGFGNHWKEIDEKIVFAYRQ